MKLGLQLYTVRDSYDNKEEFKDLLKKVKELGYDGVEFAGFCGMDATELKEYLQEIGLVPIASHQSLNDLESNLDYVINFLKKLGCKYVVCAFAPTDDMDNMSHLKEIMIGAKKLITDAGMELLYHNHSHEFKSLPEGMIPMDLIGVYSKYELDTYWVFNAGLEPCSYMRDHKDLISLIHLKDGNFEGHPLALGEGINNIKGIFEMSKIIGTEWIIVENDNPTPNGLSDVARSMEYLKNTLLNQ